MLPDVFFLFEITLCKCYFLILNYSMQMLFYNSKLLYAKHELFDSCAHELNIDVPNVVSGCTFVNV